MELEEAFKKIQTAIQNRKPIKKIQYLFKPEHLNYRRENKRSLLNAASKINNVDAVKFLLEKGADPNNDHDDKGYSPLMYASWKGHIDIVKLLLQYNANQEISPKVPSYSPIRFAIVNGHLPIVKLLTEHISCQQKDEIEYLELASGNGCIDIMKYYIYERKVDVNGKYEFIRKIPMFELINQNMIYNNITQIEYPLISAIQSQKHEATELLINLGARIQSAYMKQFLREYNYYKHTDPRMYDILKKYLIQHQIQRYKKFSTHLSSLIESISLSIVFEKLEKLDYPSSLTESDGIEIVLPKIYIQYHQQFNLLTEPPNPSTPSTPHPHNHITIYT